jgi:chemotaxis protein CheD
MQHDYRKQSTAIYLLKPGFIYTPTHGCLISATLGSGVAVCLYDLSLQRGGMGLFQYPVAQTHHHKTALFGNVSIPASIKMMRANGCRVQSLEAQVIGGAHHPLRPEKNMGEENIQIAKRLLVQHGIQIISEDVGGEKGRKIQYHTRTNELAICKLDDIPSENWYPYSPSKSSAT